MNADSRPASILDLLANRRSAQAARSFDGHVPLVVAAAGFAPIASLTFAVFEIAPMHKSAPPMIGAAVAAVIALALTHARWTRTILCGYAAAIAATLLYDLTRLPFILTGVWGDFIPHIGALLLNRSEGHRVLGYTWRWLGNGGGMGLAFFMAYPVLARRMDVRKAGLVYGVGIWACLIATILLAPRGEIMLFALSLKTLALSLLGHVVFGGSLGVIMHLTRAHLTPYVSATADDAPPSTHRPDFLSGQPLAQAA